MQDSVNPGESKGPVNLNDVHTETPTEPAKTPAAPSQLDPGSSTAGSGGQTLTALEAVIERGYNTFVDVAMALRDIKEDKLYKEAGFSNFGVYCLERWGFRRSAAYDYIKAVEVLENVGTSQQKQLSLSQAVELSALLPTEQKEMAATTDFATVTVRELRNKIKGKVRGNRVPERKKEELAASTADASPETATVEPKASVVAEAHAPSSRTIQVLYEPHPLNVAVRSDIPPIVADTAIKYGRLPRLTPDTHVEVHRSEEGYHYGDEEHNAALSDAGFTVLYHQARRNKLRQFIRETERDIRHAESYFTYLKGGTAPDSIYVLIAQEGTAFATATPMDQPIGGDIEEELQRVLEVRGQIKYVRVEDTQTSDHPGTGVNADAVPPNGPSKKPASSASEPESPDEEKAV